MAKLVSYDEALGHLRLPADPFNDDLVVKLDAAEAIVLDYLNTTAAVRAVTALWTADTVPRVVHAAILLQLGELWQFRGDQAGREGPDHLDGQLSPVVTNLLRRQRDPVLA
jgi:hypothetical protein